MNFILITLASTAGLFVGMLVFSEMGRRIGAARLARHPEIASKGSPAEAAVFALLGLLLAFTFSGAASRFEHRRHLIGEESNAIGTAYLRLDVLPADARPEIQDLVRRYLDVRTTVYHATDDQAETVARLAAAEALQGQIWEKAVAASRRPEVAPPAATFLLGALNEMIDITTTRAVASETHPPLIIFYLLGGLCLVGALLVGQGLAASQSRSWFYPVIFAAILSSAVYVIVDIEYPRLGLVRVDAADHILGDLRKSMQ